MILRTKCKIATHKYTMLVLGQAQVPFNKAKDAKDRPNTLVSMASRPVTIKVTEPPKK